MKKMVTVLLIVGTHFFAQAASQITEAMHYEALTHKNPNITEYTHPVVYDMVMYLTKVAHCDMPKYIIIHELEYFVVSEDGTIEARRNPIDAWTDIIGDLHICREVLINLSYEEAEGVIAAAIAEKVNN
jgi:hypothetical protein